MDLQDHTTPSGHGVHLCRRCGWPFPNPHPSAKHRRSHKKICGTIQGYTNLIAGSEVVSDDEHEKTPSPKIKKNRSEDDMFSDAVTEFSDSAGSVNKSLDKDVFFSFKDAENDGTNEVVNAPIEINKVDASLEVSGKQDTHVEKSQETEITTICDSSKSKSKLELTDSDAEPADDLVKDGVVEPVSQSQEARSIQVVEAGEGKSQISETISEEAKDSDISKMTPEVSETVDDNIKLENVESAKADAISEEIKLEMNDDCEPVSEVVKDSETVEGVEGIGEEIKHVKIESEIDQNVSVLIEKGDPQEQGQEGLTEKEELGAQEVVEEPDEKEDIKEPILEKGSIEQVHEVENPDSILTEKENLVAPGLEKWSEEKIQQVFEEPDTVLTEKEDIKEPILEKGSNEQVLEVEKPDSIMTEKENLELEKCSEEQIQDAVKEPETVLIVKENLGELNEPAHEVVEKPDSGLTQKQDLEVPAILERCSEESQPDSNLIENEDLVALKSEKLKVDDVSNDVSIEDSKNASGVIPVEEGNLKVINNQDCGAAFSVDSSSRNSLDANWGSVSVLSAASVDAETLEKSKANPLKSTAADSQSDVYEAPSFMTLVKPEVKDQKPGSSEPQQQPNSGSSEAGWFPSLTKVKNESEGRKRNEEVIAKVTNWGTGTSLKNLLGEAKSPPSGKQTEVEKDKDEGANGHEVSSPPKLIEDGKKGKKVKGRSSWVPFVCCSSVNVVN